MSKLKLASHMEPERRDTINLRTIVKYDPMRPHTTTPFAINGFVVARRPLPNSIHTLYMIMDGAHVVQTAISRPSEDDCAAAIAKHRRSLPATRTNNFTPPARQRKALSSRRLRASEAL